MIKIILKSISTTNNKLKVCVFLAVALIAICFVFLRPGEDVADEFADVATIAATSMDLYPVNSKGLPSDELAAKQLKIKAAHFENLQPAKKAPSHEQAQTALVQFTQGELIDVIINQKLNIKVGKCYTNPNADGNYSCVSCMVLLYNRDKKDWQEAPEGENFMKNAYDFYQASEGGFWQAKDLSMMIPYDYDLFEKYELK
ncbi:hypothetical protein [Uliginosibacterium sp. 31-12]|uniref:hypothetical protein n=1 Tax=Uliginosibacterium sp. 31-12 TaxID=3062781 RepID=UPI0026E27CAD|nr:hypothetical protein [Uliginosibacterium sp. 31-12]MDO6387864.1 hypothetical protein [Uliginosibacterium sp. 31-12]